MIQKNQKTGLTLSGGGARGYAHIGVLKALEEKEVFPQVLSGTSMGAIIGSLIANGYSSAEIIQLAHDKGTTNLFDLKKMKLGLSSHRYVRDILSSLLPKTFEELKIPLHISTTNLSQATHVVFSSGNLVDAVLASISIPLIFRPIIIDGDYYADGGIVKSLPASVIRKKCDFLIGSHTNFINEISDLKSTVDLLDRCIRVGITNTIVGDVELCDLYINPIESGGYNALNFKIIDELVEIGYREAVNALRKHLFETD